MRRGTSRIDIAGRRSGRSSILLFGYRYAIKTGQFMPRDLLAVISLVVLGVMILTIAWSPRPAAGG